MEKFKNENKIKGFAEFYSKNKEVNDLFFRGLEMVSILNIVKHSVIFLIIFSIFNRSFNFDMLYMILYIIFIFLISSFNVYRLTKNFTGSTSSEDLKQTLNSISDILKKKGA